MKKLKPLKLGVVMDPIQLIHVKKDSTLAMLLEAQKRNYILYYMEQKDLFVKDGAVFGNMRQLKVHDDSRHWFDFMSSETQALPHLDVILMRKDPPFDVEYIYTTYLLELAEAKGVLVANKPQSLRDANEKFFTTWFSQCTPELLITRDATLLHEFIRQYCDVVLKPLHGMGGGSIFKLTAGDPNINVVIEMLTRDGQSYIMAQRFIPQITEGDKRILLIDGEPIPFALARIPKAGEIRGNLAAGGTGKGVPLTKKDYWICEQLGPTLREKGLMFVGIDVIGEYLTEINVTSPTCIRELESLFDINICGKLFDCIEAKLVVRS